MSAAKVIEQIKALPKTELAQVVDFVHCLEVSKDELSSEWKTEVDNRLDDIRSGKTQTIPAEQVHSTLREKLRRHRNAS